MGFFGNLNKKYLQMPEEVWDLVEDTQFKKVWKNDSGGMLVMDTVLDTNGIPKRRDGEIIYQGTAFYGDRWISAGYGLFEDVMNAIDWWKSNFYSKFVRTDAKRNKRRSAKPKTKRKPVKKIIRRCKCKKK